jgi:hypothetical protein
MDGLKGATRAFRQYTNRVYSGIGPNQSSGNTLGVTDVNAKRHDLSNPTLGHQKFRAHWIRHGHTNDPSLCRQFLDHGSTDKARTAKYRNNASCHQIFLKIDY